MFWNKKEEKNTLPDLPPLKNPMPLFPQKIGEEDMEEYDSSETHHLPSFPDSPNQSGFSQAAIKDAVASPDVRMPGNAELEEMPSNSDGKFRTKEMEEWSPQMPAMNTERNRVQQTEFIPPPPRRMNPLEFSKKDEDVFVKIDKFHTVRKSLKDAQSQLEEISDLLKKIRETKIREEQELSAWEKNLDMIKTHVQEVTSNIFDKVE